MPYHPVLSAYHNAAPAVAGEIPHRNSVRHGLGIKLNHRLCTQSRELLPPELAAVRDQQCAEAMPVRIAGGDSAGRRSGGQVESGLECPVALAIENRGARVQTV